MRNRRPVEIVIFGGPGGGAIAGETVLNLADAGEPFALRGYLNDLLAVGDEVTGTPVLGRFEAWSDQPDGVRFTAPLHKVKQIRQRAARIEALGIPAWRWATLVDPRANVARTASLGRGCLVSPLASLMPGARLGDHVAVRQGASVSHDTLVGDFAFIGVNAVLSGYGSVGEGAHVGPGSVVRENVTIGRYAVVGIGSVVLNDVPDYAVMAGNPARRVGSVLDEVRRVRPAVVESKSWNKTSSKR